MKPHIILLGFLVIQSLYCQSQRFDEIVGNDYRIGLNPADEIQIFDKREIKNRGYKTAFIVYHPPSWDGEYCSCSYNDTIAIYQFDIEGRIAHKTEFKSGGLFQTVVWMDTLGNWVKHINVRKKETKIETNDTFYRTIDTNVRIQSIREKIGTDSLITTMYFEKFPSGYDTSRVSIKRYDSRGLLIEEKYYPSKKYISYMDCLTGEFKHNKYKYDIQKRVIYDKSERSDYHSKISYQPYGKLTETIDDRTGKLLHSDVKRIEIGSSRIIITDSRSQIFLIRLEKNSKLFKLKTITSYNSDIPYIEYYEIIFQ